MEKNEKRSTALTQSERFCRSFEGRASVSLGKLAVAKLCRITADMAPESCSQPAAGQRQTRRLWDNWVCSGKQGSELPRLKLGSCQWQHSIQNVQDVDLDVILDANLCKSFFYSSFNQCVISVPLCLKKSPTESVTAKISVENLCKSRYPIKVH